MGLRVIREEKMRKFTKFVVLGAFAAGILAAAPINMAAAETADQIVKKRQAVMKEFSAHSKAIGVYLKGNKDPKKAARLGTPDDIEFRAMGIAALADKLHTMFAQKTSLKDIPGKTRAKPEIWTDWNGFYAKTQNLKKLAQGLEKAATTRDKTQIAAAFKKMGKEGCSACHKKFRGPKPKK